MTIIEKYKSIDQTKLPGNIREVLVAMEKKSEGFTIEMYNSIFEPQLDKMLISLKSSYPNALIGNTDNLPSGEENIQQALQNIKKLLLKSPSMPTINITNNIKMENPVLNFSSSDIEGMNQKMVDLISKLKTNRTPKIEKSNSLEHGGKPKEKWAQEVKKEMKEEGTVGAFTKKAQKANKTTVQYAKKVLNNPDKYDLKTRKQAQFMKNINPELFENGGDIQNLDIANSDLFAKGGDLKLQGTKTAIYKNKKTGETYELEGVKGVRHALEFYEVVSNIKGWNSETFSQDINVTIKKLVPQTAPKTQIDTEEIRTSKPKRRTFMNVVAERRKKGEPWKVAVQRIKKEILEENK